MLARLQAQGKQDELGRDKEARYYKLSTCTRGCEDKSITVCGKYKVTYRTTECLPNPRASLKTRHQGNLQTPQARQEEACSAFE
jgi:hypothetical protein